MIGEVQSVIKLLAKTGRTMMIVTHEMLEKYGIRSLREIIGAAH